MGRMYILDKDKQKVGDALDINQLPYKERIKVRLEQHEITPIQALIQLASEEVEDFFVNELGEFYASIDINGMTKNVNIEKKHFKLWLRRIYYNTFGTPPSENTIKEALSTIIALEDGKYNNRMSSPTRLARLDDTIYIDLGHENNFYVKINKSGWEIVKSTPIKFVRPSTFLSLPTPQRGGNIHDFKRIMTVDDDQFALIMGYIVGCYNVGTPFPILVLQGGQGSAKSTTAELIKYLVDNALPLLRGFPKNEEDLMLSTQTNWVLAFDNLSNVSNHMSDALCKISTGSGFATRKFYENAEEVVLVAKRPIILNGIDYIAHRQDLASRSIIIHLPIIPENERKGHKEIWSEFKKMCPYILGIIFDAVSMALREQHHVKLTKAPRMADFAQWVTAAEPVLGIQNGRFIEIYSENLNESKLEGVEQDLMALAICKCLNGKPVIEGSATEILDILSRYVPAASLSSKEWLSAPNQFRNKINRILPLLEAKNIVYEYQRTAQERKHILRKAE
jgi:hypothetical protein